jgi:hypothetical protein
MYTIADAVKTWATDLTGIKNSLVKMHGIIETGALRNSTHGLKDTI